MDETSTIKHVVIALESVLHGSGKGYFSDIVRVDLSTVKVFNETEDVQGDHHYLHPTIFKIVEQPKEKTNLVNWLQVLDFSQHLIAREEDLLEKDEH